MPLRKVPPSPKEEREIASWTTAVGCKVKQVRLNSGKIFDLILIPTVGSEEELTRAAYLSSIADSSDTSKAICLTALLNEMSTFEIPKFPEFILPHGSSALRGINLATNMFRLGSIESIEGWISQTGGAIHNTTRRIVAQILRRGHQAIVVADQEHDIGVIEMNQA